MAEARDLSWIQHETTAIVSRFERIYSGRPDVERRRLWLFALGREQIVAVAYDEAALASRLMHLGWPEDVTQVVRQTLVWIWKDEEQHVEYVRLREPTRGRCRPVLRIQLIGLSGR